MLENLDERHACRGPTGGGFPAPGHTRREASQVIGLDLGEQPGDCSLDPVGHLGCLVLAAVASEEPYGVGEPVVRLRGRHREVRPPAALRPLRGEPGRYIPHRRRAVLVIEILPKYLLPGAAPYGLVVDQVTGEPCRSQPGRGEAPAQVTQMRPFGLTDSRSLRYASVIRSSRTTEYQRSQYVHSSRQDSGPTMPRGATPRRLASHLPHPQASNPPAARGGSVIPH
jgi:hypothetical protein